MQRGKVPYNPALDDGGGAPGAEPQRYIPGEIGDDVFTDSFEPNNDTISSFSYRKPHELHMPSWNPVAAPLDTQAPENLTSLTSYPYFRSHSAFPTQTNFSDRIHSSNNNFYSQSTAVPIQSNNVPTLSMYHREVPGIQEFSIGHASVVGSNNSSLLPLPTFTGDDRDHTSISPFQDESSDVGDNRLLERLQFYLPPAQNDTGDPHVRNTYDLTTSQRLWSHTSSLQFTPGPFMTASSLNAPMPMHLSTQESNTWFEASHLTLPQATDMGFMMAPPELHVHYASPQRLLPPSTENTPFNSYQLHSLPTYPQAFPHQESFESRAPSDIFDPVGVGTAYQGAHLYGHAEQTPPPSSETPTPPLASLHHGATIWMPYQQTGLGSPGLPITTDQHEGSPPQSFSSSSKVFGYPGQVSGGGSSGALSSSPTTRIQADARTPATDPPDTPEYGGLNTFLSQRNSISQFNKRSRLCRPPVLKHDDCPPNLRPYYNTDIPIPRHECDTMYKKCGDKELCIKCGYDSTPPRRKGLKYEHVSAHINNRPYYCVQCEHGFFRKSNHSKTHHPPLWRTTPPTSR